MRPYRELQGRVIRHELDEDGGLPCGCAILTCAIFVILLAIVIERTELI